MVYFNHYIGRIKKNQDDELHVTAFSIQWKKTEFSVILTTNNTNNKIHWD